jgi:hypothetical protein
MKAITKVPTEHQEQALFVSWIKLQYPYLRFFAVPNGMWVKNFAQIAKAKKEGQSNGVPDLCIPRRPSSGFSYNIWIEFKRTKGSVTSEDQKEWHRYLEDHSEDKVLIAYGCDDAITKLNQLLTP